MKWVSPLLPRTPLEIAVAWVVPCCLTLCDPMDCSPPGPSVHRILQARILEWVASPISRGPSQPRDRTGVSCIAGRFLTIWAIREAPRTAITIYDIISFSAPNGLQGRIPFKTNTSKTINPISLCHGHSLHSADTDAQLSSGMNLIHPESKLKKKKTNSKWLKDLITDLIS